MHISQAPRPKLQVRDVLLNQPHAPLPHPPPYPTLLPTLPYRLPPMSRTSSLRSGISSSIGNPVLRSISSMRIPAPQRA